MKNFDSGSPHITTYHKYFKVKGHFFLFLELLNTL